MADTDSIRLTFEQQIKNALNLKQHLVVTIKDTNQGVESSPSGQVVEITGHTTSSSEQTVFLKLNLSGEISNGEFTITRAPQSYSEIVFALKEDVVSKFNEYPIKIPGVSFYKMGGKASQITGSTLKTASLVSGGLVAYLSPQTALMLIKVVQVFDYMGLINVVSPDNLTKFLQMFTDNMFDLVPNIFEHPEYEDDGAWESDVTQTPGRVRLLEDTQSSIAEKQCRTN